MISDSSIICAYLEKQFPTPAIYPLDAQQYAKTLWYEEYADSQLIPTIFIIFFNTMLAPIFNREPNLHALDKALTHQLPKIFDYLFVLAEQFYFPLLGALHQLLAPADSGINRHGAVGLLFRYALNHERNLNFLFHISV